MKSRPILFSAPMIRAILDGRKTHRRLYVRKGEDPTAPAHLARRVMNGVESIDEHGCWIWGRTTSAGYGCMTVRGRSVRVPRLVLALVHNKGVADVDEACHRCDQPLCVNPDHLFEGTHGDNVRDAVRKGRAKPPTAPVLRGELNPAARLSDADAAAVREAIARGERQRVIAARHGVSQSTISSIKLGKSRHA